MGAFFRIRRWADERQVSNRELPLGALRIDLKVLVVARTGFTNPNGRLAAVTFAVGPSVGVNSGE